MAKVTIFLLNIYRIETAADELVTRFKLLS